MKKKIIIVFFLFLPAVMFSQIIYTFIGNGDWSIDSNWANNAIPPSTLPSGSTIIINPASGDSCILNVLQFVSVDAFFNVASGANFIVTNNLFIKGSNLSPDSSFIDSRDGQVYTYRHIGTQVWMTKNLNYAIDNSWCYEDKTDNCEMYGRLYDWNSALIAAPLGWHLPSDSEWTVLTTFLDANTPERAAGASMKKISVWQSPNTGATNSSGFSGLPGGIAEEGGKFFQFIGTNGYWWSSTANDNDAFPNLARRRALNYYSALVYSSADDKSRGYSIRCIRN